MRKPTLTTSNSESGSQGGGRTFLDITNCQKTTLDQVKLLVRKNRNKYRHSNVEEQMVMMIVIITKCFKQIVGN